MSSMYYDRAGKPITSQEWQDSFNTKGKRVAETTLPSGKWVSTVWLGLNHAFSQGPPLIFETMVFGGDNAEGGVFDMERYSTEEQAIAGHQHMVEKWGRS